MSMSMSMSKVNVGHMGTSNGNQLYVDIAGYRILVCIHLTDIARHKTIENHEEFGTSYDFPKIFNIPRPQVSLLAFKRDNRLRFGMFWVET